MANVEKQTYTLSVYNTLTGKTEEVEVPEEVPKTNSKKIKMKTR